MQLNKLFKGIIKMHQKREDCFVKKDCQDGACLQLSPRKGKIDLHQFDWLGDPPV